MTVIGLLTIGQAPRPDIVDSMFTAKPNRLLEFGALDDLSRHEIAALEPVAGEHPLVTRLHTGEELVIAKERVLPCLQRAADTAVRQGATLLVVLCTGTFPGLRAPVPIVYPDRLLVATVNALLPVGALGVLMPHPGQYETMAEKWALAGRRFVGGVVSPYDARTELERIGRKLASQGVDLIVLDCMGYTQAMKQTIAEASGRPVVLANRLVGRVVEELLDTAVARGARA